MADDNELEQRIATLEREIRDLKAEVARRYPAATWVDRVSGSFEGDEDFREVLKLGQEIRRAELATDD